MRDSEYKYLSNSVYEVDTKKVSRSWKEGDTLEGSQSNNNFKSLKVEDNQNNGMQAMAVAPVNGRGEVDTSKITIA
jgi:complete genome